MPVETTEETKRSFRSPVAWLLGRQLLASLKSIALYSAFGHQIDAKRWMSAGEIDLSGYGGGKDEFWFDYIADVGDGQRAVYSVGAMVLAHWSAEEPLRVGTRLSLEASDEKAKLPRGAFLFVGGDTCYHISDYATLADRFQRPLRWAYEDLEKIGHKPVEDRPLVGIPGNHDYYDSLNGFYLQFRKPSPGVEDRDWVDKPKDMVTARLFLKGFRRIQEASYVALRLPFHWRLWGLDTQHGELDQRQKYFFRGLMEKDGTPPSKLIVATPEPTTVFGRHCRPDAAVAKSFEDVGLKRPFLEPAEDGTREQLPDGVCRLDLSGDVHHYARYLGGDPDGSSHYASVVSGGGGAFLHPTVTNFDELPAETIYPDPEHSHREVTRRLLNPWNIVRGGYVWLAGALVALVLVLGMAVAESSRDATNRLLGGLGLAPLGVDPKSDLSALEPIFEVPRISAENSPTLWHPELGFVFLFVALMGLGAWQSHRWCRRARGVTGSGWDVVGAGRYWGVYLVLSVALMLSMGTAAVTVAGCNSGGEGGLWTCIAKSFGVTSDASVCSALHPLTSSFLFLVFLGVTGGAFYWSREYSDALVHQARLRSLKYRDFTLLWYLMVFAVAALCFGAWRYGGDPLAVVVSDVIFLIVVLFLGLGLPGLGLVVGAQRHGWRGKLGFLFLGIWHLILQVTLPVLLALYCDPWWWSLVVVAAVALVSASTWRWTRWGSFGKWGLLSIWLLLGISVLALASVFAGWSLAAGNPPLLTVPRLLLALVLGAVLSCVWFGWYLAVSVPFNGHNNEAGGGSRLEKYKQMIRFRVTKDELTGYVIAFDEPVTSVRDLRPKVVDVFRIRVPKRSDATSS